MSNSAGQLLSPATAGLVIASRHGLPSAADAATPSELWPPSRRSPSSWTSRMSGRQPRRSSHCPPPLSALRTSVQPVGRTSGVQASGGQATGAIQVSGRTGLRCPRRCRRAVRAALDLEWLGVVGRPGRAQRVDVPRSPRAAWSPACIGPDGKGRCDVGRAWLARGSTVARAAAWPASGCGVALAPAGRPGSWSRARVPAGWREHGTEQVLTGPARASWAGRRRGARF